MAKLPNIHMVRENLENIPAYELPAPYAVRWFQAGDERKWVNVVSGADIYNTTTLQTHKTEFGEDLKTISARQFFFIDRIGKPVGTCTSWFEKEGEEKGLGRIHWVMLLPEVQGKGLSKSMLSLALTRLKELGHSKTILTTQPPRLPAIALYLKFGFTPLLKNLGDDIIWQSIFTDLKKSR